jgi:hypothetical protein
MTDQRFIDALLSLEDCVSQDEYAAYRLTLARRIDAEADRQPSRRGCRMRPHLAAAILLLATGIAFSVLRQASDGRSASIVLAQRNFEGKPYTDVVEAQLVALVRTESPRQQHGITVYPLRIERILKDETRKAAKQFACEFQEQAQSGEQYLACISENDGEWSLRSIARVDKRYQQDRLPGVERCVSIQAASHSDDPAQLYRQLLAAEAGGVDEAAGCVFCCRPDPHSADTLLARLETFRDQLRHRIAPVARPLPPAGEVARVAYSLEKLNEPRAAGLVADCAQFSRPGERAALYESLPGLCRTASPEVRKSVQRLLQDEIDNRAGDANDGRQARQALARMNAR